MVHHRGGGLLDHAFVWLTSPRASVLSGWRSGSFSRTCAGGRSCLPLVAADLLADLISDVIKALTDRPRPPVRYPEPHPLIGLPNDSSFPSGHAATSFACATVLTAYEPRLAPLWIVLASAVAFSRVYVGVHYPLDVIGGAALGVAVGIAVLYATRSSSEARSKPATITAIADTRLIQIPIPRPLAGRNSSGIEIRRIRTKMVAIAPSAMIEQGLRDRGRDSIPNSSRMPAITTTASPSTKTSLPSVPVCHPITLITIPSPEPEYQPMKDDSISTSPETHVMTPPAASIGGAA